MDIERDITGIPDKELTPRELFQKYARKPKGGPHGGGRPTKKPRPKVVPVEKVLMLRRGGVVYEDIGKITGLDKQVVERLCKKHSSLLGDVTDYSKNKADLLESIQRDIVLTLSGDVIEKAPFRDRINAVGLLEGIIRKERGLDDKKIINVFALTVKAAYEKKSDRPDNLGTVVVEVENAGISREQKVVGASSTVS